MTFDLFTRRLHLYLGLFLLPWFFMYGLSSLPFSHAEYFQKFFGAPGQVVHFERAYLIDIPPKADLKQAGRKILEDNGLRGDFGAYRPNDRELVLWMPGFITPTTVRYNEDQKMVVSSSPTFRFNQFLTRMHTMGGFEHESWLRLAWGVLVDLSCLGILLWMASGIYMWWKLGQTRAWGLIALAGGGVSFAVFLVKL